MQREKPLCTLRIFCLHLHAVFKAFRQGPQQRFLCRTYRSKPVPSEIEIPLLVMIFTKLFFVKLIIHNRLIVITHYQRLLDYIKPDIVHVLYKGRIVKTAGPELALELEEKGYDWIKKELGE